MPQVKLKITKTDNSTLEIDRFSGLQTVESLTQSTPDASSIYYGTLANSGSAQIVDKDGEIKDLIEDGDIENSNTNVDLYIDDHLVQKHITTDSDYNEENIFSMQFTNKLEYWDKINYDGYPYPNTSKTAYEMLEDVLTKLGYSSNDINTILGEQIIYGDNAAYGTIKSYLQLITIPYPYLPSDTYRNTIDKFCRLAQLQVYQPDNSDLPKFVSARPLVKGSQASNAIVVPKYAQLSKLNKTVILKNKYDAVEIQKSQVNDVTNYDEFLSSTIINKSDISYIFASHNYVGGVPLGQGYGVVRKLEGYYTEGNFDLIKNSNYNLTQILSASITGDADENGYYNLSKRDNKYTFSVNYDKILGTFINEAQVINDIGDFYDDNNTFATTEYYSNVNFNNVPDDTFKGQIPVTYNSASPYNADAISITDGNYIKIKDMGDYFNIKYYILSRVVFYDLDVDFSYPTIARSFKNPPRIYKNEAVGLEISVYGNKRTIYFENISASDDTSSAKTIATVQGSELLQTGTKYNNSKVMSTLIKDNIKSDYSNGISSGNINLFCTDFFNSSDSNVVDFSTGNIIENNSIVSIAGDDKKWKVTGRKFNYDGQSSVNIEVKEVASQKYTIIFPNSVYVYNGSTRIHTGDIVEDGTTLRAKFQTSNGTLNYMKLNGNNINDNSTFTVSSNCTITVSYENKVWFDLYRFNLSSNSDTTTINLADVMPSGYTYDSSTDNLVANYFRIESNVHYIPYDEPWLASYAINGTITAGSSSSYSVVLEKRWKVSGGNTIDWTTVGSVVLDKDKITITCSDTSFRGTEVTGDTASLYRTRTIVE